MVLHRIKNYLDQRSVFNHLYTFNILLILAIFTIAISLFFFINDAFAVETSLNTSLPKKSYNIPAESLGKALATYSAQAGIALVFDPALTEGKGSAGLKGEYGLIEGYKALLKNTGLEINNNDKGEYSLSKIPKPALNQNLPDIEIDLKETQIRASRFKSIGPLPGLALTKEQIAGNVQSISAKEIKEAHSMSLSDLMNSKLQSVNVNDYQGNPFQMDVTYRGFTASPQIGTPQGLSVFFDGIRINEPFGDVVNWDMIPMNALGGFDVFPGSNPLFGLNTLGGALSMKTKSGFTDPGVSFDILTGSYGRKQLQASGGWNNGSIAAFGAVNLFLEDGWRKNSPSKVNQAFGKVEWQGERASLSFSTLAVINKLVGNGTVPQELYNQDASAVFTSPDETKNKLLQFQIAGAFDITDTMSLTGQIYNRSSDRNSTTGDIIDFDTFSNADHSYHMYATRLPGQGASPECAYGDSNKDGIPDFYMLPEANQLPFLIKLGNGVFDTSLLMNESQLTANNITLPSELTDGLRTVLKSGVWDIFVNPTTPSTDALPLGVMAYQFMDYNGGGGLPYIDAGGHTNYVFAAPALNAATCRSIQEWNQGMIASQPYRDRDGNNYYAQASGVVEGTPTAVITNSNIQQSSKGAALQLNWNLDQHKFMIGASIDKSYASYIGKQRLGLLDDNRNVYSDPSQLGEEFYTASHDLTINDFNGTSETKSLYFSENWAPIQTLNLSLSARYNNTDVKNNLAPSIADSRLENLHVLNRYAFGVICAGNDLSNCPYNLGPIPADIYWNQLVSQSIRDQINGHGLNVLDKKQTEEFSYRSINPAIGVTWQAKPNLNMYANWNQGTRAPSVIELGCAYDDTLVNINHGPGAPIYQARSIADGRGCKLPSALSGDPYLPQVKAQTMEVGARGKFKDFLEWNVSAYRTDVEDDIYMTSVTSELSFFQSIGDTRRQGIEFGLASEYGKSNFRVNYSLTEATFQSNFKTISSNNSSRGLVFGPDYNMIDVQPGNVMPGVPFNNVNFNWGYKLTRDLKLNFSLVAHSGSFLRGNENNAHTPSPGRLLTDGNGVTYKTPDNTYSGTAPGYAVLNFNARYDLGGGWAASILVNNVLDKKYYTAGRLGLNPIAPSTVGAIGPGGFNYNSSEWLSSQFISAGAPRGVWVSLSYDFDASKKPDVTPANYSVSEPDRTLDPPSTMPTQEELALMHQLDKIKAVPVLKYAKSAVKVAEEEVKTSIEQWRNTLLGHDAEAYLKAYASTFAPAGVSHNNWAEQQKLHFITDDLKLVDVSDVVVAPQGLRMVAVFNYQFGSGQQQEISRKVLTFEQKDGQWLIVKEHALPAANAAIKAQASPLSSLIEPSIVKPTKSRLLKYSKIDRQANAEAQ